MLSNRERNIFIRYRPLICAATRVRSRRRLQRRCRASEAQRFLLHCEDSPLKYCRFSTPDGPQFGLIETVAGAERITSILPDSGGVPDFSRPKSMSALPLSSATLLASAQPTKIVCVGRNYRDHAKELGSEVPSSPLIFMKPPSSIIGPGDKIVRPKISQRVDYEVELAVIVKERCRHVRADEDVRRYILGYTCANDVTPRALQKKDDQWTPAKSFYPFCPTHPTLV